MTPPAAPARRSTQILLALGLVAVGCGVAKEEAPRIKEIARESVSETGGVSTVAFTSEIAAPPDRVWEEPKQAERAHEVLPASMLESQLVSAEGDAKVVDLVIRLDVLPLGFKVQNRRIRCAREDAQRVAAIPVEVPAHRDRVGEAGADLVERRVDREHVRAKEDEVVMKVQLLDQGEGVEGDVPVVLEALDGQVGEQRGRVSDRERRVAPESVGERERQRPADEWGRIRADVITSRPDIYASAGQAAARSSPPARLTREG